MPDYLCGTAGKAAEPDVDAAGFPDLFLRFDVRYAMFGGHGSKHRMKVVATGVVQSSEKDVFFFAKLADFSGGAGRCVLIGGGCIVIRHDG